MHVYVAGGGAAQCGHGCGSGHVGAVVGHTLGTLPSLQYLPGCEYPLY